jgi:multiple sugar transport system ATP-binding protein
MTIGQSTVQIPVNLKSAVQNLRKANRFVFGIRPEAFRLADATPVLASEAEMDVGAELIEPTGSDDIVLFKFAEQEMTARIRTGSISGTGTVRLRLDASKLVVFDKSSGKRVD